MHNAQAIHVQRFHGGSPYSGFARQASTISAPVKMTMPTLSSRVEQPYAAACLRIARRDVRTLGIVANRTRVAQVVQFSLASQRSWNDMIDFERIGAQLLL